MICESTRPRSSFTAKGVAADVVVELLPQYISALAVHVAIDDDVVSAALHFNLLDSRNRGEI